MMKKSLLLSLTGLGLLAGVSGFAQINVKSDLSNAIQNIQRVYFSPEGIKDSDPTKNILVEISNGVIKVQGKVIMEEGQATNRLAAQTEGSLVLQGKENTLLGNQTISVGGTANTVAQNIEKGILLGGKSNAIGGASQQGVLIAGSENVIKNWSHSVVSAGELNKIEGSSSFIAGGQLVELKGDRSFAAGKNIKPASTPKNNVFLWSDNNEDARDDEYLIPSQNNTFLIRSANGLGIGTDRPQVKGIDVQGLIQIGNEAITCSASTAGAMKFKAGVGTQKGCFCSCNGSRWVAMSPSRNCMNACR